MIDQKTRQVDAVLNYTVRIDGPIRNYYLVDPPAGDPASNEKKDPHEVRIHSMREADEPMKLDKHGFKLVSFSPDIEDIYDAEQRKTGFDPAVVELVKKHTGASEVRVFDPFLRGPEAERRLPGSIAAPAGMIHVDYTHDSGPVWFERFLGPDADRFRGRRFAIVNVWRPITGPLRDFPLAVCDVGSIDQDDYILTEVFSRRDSNGMATAEGVEYASELYALAYNAAHRWYYVPDMMPDEALLLKNYDSLLDGVSRFSPHTAFADPTAPDDRLPRASIEVRALAIW